MTSWKAVVPSGNAGTSPWQISVTMATPRS